MWPYSPNQFLAGTCFAVYYSKTALRFLFEIFIAFQMAMRHFFQKKNAKSNMKPLIINSRNQKADPVELKLLKKNFDTLTDVVKMFLDEDSRFKRSFKGYDITNCIFLKHRRHFFSLSIQNSREFLGPSWQAVFHFLWWFCIKYEKCHFFVVCSLKTL